MEFFNNLICRAQGKVFEAFNCEIICDNIKVETKAPYNNNMSLPCYSY